ncbi:MAG: hypothetical protein JST55_08395 [Bacteroidetes bacterium]|nr:hypothetical protein [Bacteroidota bacterium]
MQKSIIYVVLLIVCSFVFSSCSLFSSRYEKIEKGEFSISAIGKKKFSLNNVNGKVRVVRTTDQSTIIVKYEKTAYVRKKDLGTPLNEIKLNLDTMSADVKIETDIENEKNVIQFGSIRSNKVDYEIYIPDGIVLNVDNTNGSIDLTRLSNEIKASTENGSIKIDNVNGKMELETTNGSIKGSIDSTQGIRAETVNGSIKLNLSSRVSAKVNAEVVNGSVKIEGLNFKNSTDKKERRTFQGILGNGDAIIKLETTNGSIRLTGNDTNTEI